MKAKHWIFLLSGILMISFLLLFLPYLFQPENPIAEIYQNGVLIQTVSLHDVSSPYTIPISQKGKENILLVSEGSIRMESANCPDKLCVHQGEIHTGSAPIVCLPHRLVIQIKNGTSSVDAVSQ